MSRSSVALCGADSHNGDPSMMSSRRSPHTGHGGNANSASTSHHHGWERHLGGVRFDVGGGQAWFVVHDGDGASGCRHRFAP